MYDAEITAVATGAAGTLVAAIATWGAGKMQSTVAHFFRLGTAHQQQAATVAVGTTAAQLSSEDGEARAAATEAWAEAIARYLSEHREAMAEVDGLAQPMPSTSNVWNQRNSGTGTFIGGNVYGGLTLSQDGTPDGGR
ncbi:hypothetical protein ACFCX4_00215 [Kitasatospora sp. NPDC056327]|uniref:hypothetical protein n=1 Tax=Kitasatospora sp. NPDC056327 TaxID=3345785 RepID=UPI0035DD5F98